MNFSNFDCETKNLNRSTNPMKIKTHVSRNALCLVIILGSLAPMASRADQLFADDVIVQGGLSVGLDSYTNYSFGSDTFVLRENNLRILFNDTSTSSGFPSNNWRITIN